MDAADSTTPIPGTVFRIEGVDSDYLNTVTTGQDGTVTLRVAPGTFRVTELSVPAPYILDTNNRQSIVLDPGASRELTFENSTEPGLRIIKKDKLTGAPVPGVTFLIEKIDGSYSEEATTGDNGEIFIEGLRVGDYTVSEVSDGASANYVLPADKKVTILADKTTVAQMHNDCLLYTSPSPRD